MISKALRFEVLRRDGFACRYCGRRSPDVELHIDHINPTALGGQDEPENLATSCAECNAGKGSTPPDAELVAEVSKDAERWAAAIDQAGQEMVAEVASVRWFTDLWLQCQDAETLPLNANQIVLSIMRAGLPAKVIEEMFWVAMAARGVRDSGRFAYFRGCCNNRLRDLHARAAELIAEAE